MASIVSPKAFWGETAQPIEWRERAQSDTFYAASTLCPVLMGWGVHAAELHLFLTCPWFPWWLIKLSLCLQGWLSYQGDVATFGEASGWKAADVWLATLHTSCYILFALFPLVGIAAWPAAVSLTQATAAGSALYGKKMGTRALKDRHEAAFFWHHSMWHYIALFGAAASLCIIVITSPASSAFH